jgi:hypothetical protein
MGRSDEMSEINMRRICMSECDPEINRNPRSADCYEPLLVVKAQTWLFQAGWKQLVGEAVISCRWRSG